MKRETINKIANFILTVITAFVSTFLMQSCIKFKIFFGLKNMFFASSKNMLIFICLNCYSV